MKNLFLVFFLLVIACNYSFSQSIYQDSLVLITKQQLKLTNLIFLEHDKFKKEINLLDLQITQYKQLIDNYRNRELEYRNQISILTRQTASYKEDLFQSEQLIIKKEKRLKRAKKWVIGLGCVSVGLLTCLLVN